MLDSPTELVRKIVELPRVSAPSLSPTGEWVAYKVSTLSVETDQGNDTQWLSYVGPAASVATKRMPQLGSWLGWHPDGRLVFQTEDSIGLTLLFCDPTSGRTASLPLRMVQKTTQTAKLPGRIAVNGCWSPSGRFYAFSYFRVTNEAIVINGRKGVPIRALKPHLFEVEQIEYELYIVDTRSGDVEQVLLCGLPGKISAESTFTWSPDDSQLAISVDDVADADSNGVPRGKIAIIERRGGEAKKLVYRKGENARCPSWSPDGRSILFAATYGAEQYPHNEWEGASILVVSLETGKISKVQPQSFPGFSPGSSSISHNQWTTDSRHFFYTTFHGMKLRRMRADVTALTSEEVPVPLPDGSLSHERWSISLGASRMAFLRSSPTSPGEIYTVNLTGSGVPVGCEHKITNVDKSEWLQNLVKAEQVVWRSADNKYDIHGIFYRPQTRSADHSKPPPALIFIEGGPAAVASRFRDPDQMWPLAAAAHGYAVLIPNHRGCAGYGVAFRMGIRDSNSRYHLPYEDVVSGVNHLVSHGLIDEHQVGIQGQSYGGGLTAYAVTQTERFRAAIINDGGLLNFLESQRMLRFRPRAKNSTTTALLYGKDSDPYVATERNRMISESPLLLANNVRTPVLLLTGREDTPHFPEQMAFFAALTRFGVPTAMFVYDMNHAPETPVENVDNIVRGLEWLDHWVRGLPFADAERAKEFNEWKTW